MADDLGYGDVGAYGAKKENVKTPKSQSGFDIINDKMDKMIYKSAIIIQGSSIGK